MMTHHSQWGTLIVLDPLRAQLNSSKKTSGANLTGGSLPAVCVVGLNLYPPSLWRAGIL